MTANTENEAPVCRHCGFPFVAHEAQFAVTRGMLQFCGVRCADQHKQNPTVDAQGYPHALCAGTRRAAHGESWTHWAVYDNAHIQGELADTADDAGGLAEYLTGWACAAGSPGRTFRAAPWAKVGKYHTLVTQQCGLDI